MASLFSRHSGRGSANAMYPSETADLAPAGLGGWGVSVDPSHGGVGNMSLSDTEIISALPQSSSSGWCRGQNRRRCLWCSLCSLATVGAAAAILAFVSWGSSAVGRLGGKNGPDQGGGPAAIDASNFPSHPAYEVSGVAPVDEYGLDLVTYVHASTGAELLASMPRVEEFDGDRAFGISFRTNPTDDTGVAHILEHSVLSGSRAYPVKDPFQYLEKGSLQTFLNAMTYPDRTVYPIASRNRKDFANLMGVYLDAVFHPNCVKDDWVMRQEGWRYELNEEADELELRGVVMSEMMGAYSDPDEIMYQAAQTLLFPDTTYKYDSGGEPSAIPDLTFEGLQKFYEEHYHPTNSKAFVGGDGKDVAEALRLFDEYASEFGLVPDVKTNSEVPYQKKKFDEPLRERREYAVADEDDDAGVMVRISWLLNDVELDPMTELALLVLDDLLLGSPTAVLRKALLDSGLGEEVIDDGLETELIQSIYSVGMKGVQDEGDAAEVEKHIMDVLNIVSRDGFDEDDVEASVNSVEFGLREFNAGDDPQAITIFLAIMSKWNYDMAPERALLFDAPLSALKEEIAQRGSGIFQTIVKKMLVQNTHRVVLEFYPSATYEAEQEQKEKEALAEVLASLSDNQLIKIKDDTMRLKQIHDEDDPPEAVAKIPKLSLADLNKRGIEHPIEVTKDAYNSGVTLLVHEVPSSAGIAYVNFGLDMSSISYEDVALLPLFKRMMMETGTSALSDKQLDQQIGIHTGGINMNTYITDVNPPGEGGHIVLSGNNLRTLLFLSGKCMPDKASKLFGLYVQILKNANLDSPQKAVQILQEMVSEIKNDVSSSGTSYVLKRIRARYSVKGFVDEQMDGVAEAKAMEFFLGLAREHWGTLLGRLERMRHAILGSAREGMILNLTGDKKVLSLISSDVREFLTKGVPLIPELDSGSLETSASASLQDFATTSHPWVMPAMDVMSKDAPVRDEMIVTPTKVSYVGKGGLLYDLGEQVTGSATVAAQYLKHGYLYENIRLRNGAYGAWTALASAEGTLVLLSYRDPELGKTLEVFDLAADDLLEDATSGVLAEKGSPAITTAIIGAIGSLDGSALPPDEVGWESLTQWLKGSTVEGRQKWRDEILKTQASDFTDFAQRLKGWKQPSIAVVGSQFAYDEYSATAGYPPLEIVANI